MSKGRCLEEDGFVVHRLFLWELYEDERFTSEAQFETLSFLVGKFNSAMLLRLRLVGTATAAADRSGAVE